MYSGDTAFVGRMLPLMRRMLDRYIATLSDGLFPCPLGKRFWHFYDWADGLDGTMRTENDGGPFHFLETPRFDAPLNFFLILALNAAANMARWTGGDEEFIVTCAHRADSLRQAAHRAFWDAAAGAYVTSIGPGAGQRHFAELTQSLAILAGLGDDEHRRALRRKLMSPDNHMTPTTLSQSLYKYEAILLDDSLDSGRFVFDSILQQWSAMLLAGATTFWETLRGGWDFHHAGSLCHGWSGLPVYFYGAYGLGLKPMEPGFARIGLKPLLGIDRPRGIVPTPRGPIDLRLTLDPAANQYAAIAKVPESSHLIIDRARLAECKIGPTREIRA
jgi:hypothetical protein